MASLTNLKKGNDLFLSAIKHLLFVGILAAFVGCVNHEVALPKGYLTEAQMLPIMVDIHLIEGARSGTLVLGDTNALPDYYAKIYQKHNITDSAFKVNFAWYTEHPEKLKAIYEAVIVELSVKEEEVKANLKTPPTPVNDAVADTARTAPKTDAMNSVKKILKN